MSDSPPTPVPEFIEQRPAEPAGSLWLVYLFFRPRTFFRHFVIEPAPLLTALAAWLYGMAGALDRLDTQLLRGRPGADLLASTWATYWLFAACAGIVAGLLYFSIGGWWYTQRLRWSGADEPDGALSRRVYLYAALVWALPALAVTVMDTFSYPEPEAAILSEGTWWHAVIVLFPFWSLWVSYRGVRTAFVVRRVRAMSWFLILPGLFYAGAFVAVMVALFAMPADVDNPQRHQGSVLSFSYPGNWWIDASAEDYDPDFNLTVEPAQDALFRVMVYPTDSTPADELDATLTGYAEVMNFERPVPFSQWGNFSGSGKHASGDLDGIPAQLRVWVGAVGEGMMLEIQELCTLGDLDKVAPGFDLIEQSLRIGP